VNLSFQRNSQQLWLTGACVALNICHARRLVGLTRGDVHVLQPIQLVDLPFKRGSGACAGRQAGCNQYTLN
jgi:hypothetical protein